ncbi:ArsR family transcriptional regulator [Ensifer adhaerens]|uniref:ArsR family transcriptional regulator n=1 Tax=Ensifer adhaerens TaxID=106592 RepID=A0A0L8BMT9_ENSAD|nr:metalloregulator ArsR/SmtB family transcription factor [Ensifer adhaerens]KOF15986.1 ArsR family transcriptional regulator [Ensifer adhaerens]
MSDLQLHIFEEFAELARTLASAQRLLLLEHIAQGERSVERLAELSGLSVANASQHLQQLRRAGFVETRREGKRVLYRLGTGPVLGLLSALRQHAEYNRAQIRDLVADRRDQPDRLEAISREELLLRMREGGVTLLDVRPQDEFTSGHLPGAINIPIEELERRFAELPAQTEIVAYCRGPYCALSFDAVTVLQGKGFSVRRLDSGFPDWKAAGLAVESAA